MIPQKGGGSHGHPRTTPSYAPVGQGGALIQTRGIFEQGCYCFANYFVEHIGNSSWVRHPAGQGGIPQERDRDAYCLRGANCNLWFQLG